MKPARKVELYPRSSRAPKANAADPLLHVQRYLRDDQRAQLAADVRRGLTRHPKRLPPKYFYDDRGSRLFEAICELPEYYPTRTEHALLTEIADAVIAATRPTQMVELGSGASRKTRVLLDALTRVEPAATYMPIDVSESTLRHSAAALRVAYPSLRVHAIVADYERGLPRLAGAGSRLVVFLGSTIGNFVPPDDVTFLRRLAEHLTPGEHLLLGVDLVKPVARLHAAYNDAAGVTAEFNRNVLRVLNRELQADFDLERFEHVAFYDPSSAQIEMHLRARTAHTVRLAALDLTIAFRAGETIHTESSRKFTRATAAAMLGAAGFRLDRWYTSSDNAFALALATVEGAG
jgi:L-histidine N-alpha-methyltransferase